MTRINITIRQQTQMNFCKKKNDYTVSNHCHHTGRAGPSGNLHQCLPIKWDETIFEHDFVILSFLL